MPALKESTILFDLQKTITSPARIFITTNINGDYSSFKKLLEKSKFSPLKGDVILSLGDFFGSDSQTAFTDNIELAKIAQKTWCHLLVGYNEYWINESYCAVTTKNQSLLELCVDNLGGWFSDYLTKSNTNAIFSAVKSSHLMIDTIYQNKKVGFCVSTPTNSDWNDNNMLFSFDKLIGDVLFNKNLNKAPARFPIKGVDHLYICGLTSMTHTIFNTTSIANVDNNKRLYLIESPGCA